MPNPSSDKPAAPALDSRGLPVGYNLREDWEVTPRQTRDMLERKGDVVLLDCRRPDEWQTVRIEGARLAPLNELPARLDDLDELRDKDVIVYCHHGVRSLRAAAFLRSQGFTSVKSMAGGIDLWAIDVAPGMRRY